MALSPLAVMILAQLGLVMLAVIIFQKLQKRRLIKELESIKAHVSLTSSNKETTGDSFDRYQAELLLNRIYQSSQNMISEAPACRALGQEQQSILYSLAECIDLPLAGSNPKPVADQPVEDFSSDIISQQEIDSALGREEAIEEFDLDDFEDLETSSDAIDDDFDLLIDEEPELPEDTLQVALDNIDHLEFSDLENELLKEK